MPHDDTIPRTAAANAARVRILAQAAAQDPRKLARALRVVTAAIELGIVAADDLNTQSKDAA